MASERPAVIANAKGLSVRCRGKREFFRRMTGMAKQQWHPTFAQLLRPLVEGHYEVKTDVPVGDLPRQADIVLLRRTSRGPLPFRGLWQYLTTWNVLEFKGPTVSPRSEDLDL